ncbi:MAG TPA: chitobiase/beta-hexosaminidase C-terminal domain-containing protein [Chthoniobacterales bacterium]|nr:chitobiase/beta-hexosaminidase C-terminal domain-containing protein [Chthoniobacterales bacterium]
MSVGNEKFVTDMRDALKAMMEAEPYFSNTPIVTERLQNVDAKIDQIVAKAGGIAIVLVTPEIGGAMPNVKGANFDKILFAARVYENVKTNPTGKEAQHVAIYIAAFWSQLKPDALSAPLKLVGDGVTLGNDPRYLTYDVEATTEGGVAIDIPRLADLEIQTYTQPFGVVPVETFNDGTRDYTWRPANGRLILAGAEPDADDLWLLDPVPPSEGVNASAMFQEVVAGNVAGHWLFTRIDGVWTLVENNPEGSASPPPVIPDGFEFFTETAVSIALAHATPGAVIYCTVDGSPAFPRNPAASLYLATFNAAPGTTLRARAWLPGFIPSAETKVTL